jgi:hypothetical protein
MSRYALYLRVHGHIGTPVPGAPTIELAHMFVCESENRLGLEAILEEDSRVTGMAVWSGACTRFHGMQHYLSVMYPNALIVPSIELIK